MDIALIPPIPELRRFSKGRPYHLILSHLLNDPKYLDFYRRESLDGASITLDNSAHEHLQGEEIRALVSQATQVGAREIVLPDALFDSRGTIESTKSAILFLRDHWLDSDLDRFIDRVMIVPQGKTIDDFRDCLIYLMSTFDDTLWPSPSKPGLVLGISKDYNNLFEGGLLRLIPEVILPFYGDLVAIHLLGWVLPLQDLSTISLRFGKYIRSVDSARPFVYAKSGFNLQAFWDGNHATPIYPKRDKKFFTKALSEREALTAQSNCIFFEKCARGEINDPNLSRL